MDDEACYVVGWARGALWGWDCRAHRETSLHAEWATADDAEAAGAAACAASRARARETAALLREGSRR